MLFECETTFNNKSEKWSGEISSLKKCDACFEVFLDSRSSLRVVFGKASFGGFACIPDFEAGCHLIKLSDKFWNTEKLVSALGKIDGITVASALYELDKNLNFIHGRFT